MTSSQRKAHKIIWLSIVILIPVIIVFSLKDLKNSNSENNVSKVETSKKTILKSAENKSIKVLLKENSIEIILKTTLKSSSTLVYSLNEKDEKGIVIGQLSTTGIYNFKITELPKGIVLYDPLKDKLITKIVF